MRRTLRLGAVFGVAAFGLAGASVAQAGGNGAQTFTQHDHGLTMVLPPGPGENDGQNPCTGTFATITLVVNDVFHGTINKTGSWFTGTIEGTFTMVPITYPAEPSYSGHFATWFGDENNLRNSVEHSTFNLHGVGSDGSTLQFHLNDQATVNANGVVTVSFTHARCG